MRGKDKSTKLPTEKDHGMKGCVSVTSDFYDVTTNSAPPIKTELNFCSKEESNTYKTLSKKIAEKN